MVILFLSFVHVCNTVWMKWHPSAGHLAWDGSGVLQVPVLLLPHGPPEPEGHVRPPALPAGELEHPAVAAIPEGHHSARCGLLLPHGQHWAGSRSQVQYCGPSRCEASWYSCQIWLFIINIQIKLSWFIWFVCQFQTFCKLQSVFFFLLREHHLEKIAVYLSRCGLQSNTELVERGYPDLGWDPVEGERFLDFLRFCVWVGGRLGEGDWSVWRGREIDKVR